MIPRLYPGAQITLGCSHSAVHDSLGRAPLEGQSWLGGAMPKLVSLFVLAIVCICTAAPACAQNTIIGTWTNSVNGPTGQRVSSMFFTFHPNGQYQVREFIDAPGPNTAGGVRVSTGTYQFDGRRVSYQIRDLSWCVNSVCGLYPYAYGPWQGAFDVQFYGIHLIFHRMTWTRQSW